MRRTNSYAKHLWWIIPVLVADYFLFSHLLRRGSPTDGSSPSTLQSVFQTAPLPPPSPWKSLRFPTDQDRLLDPEPMGAFQPTASGNPESALYGSVRTQNSGSGLLSSFHEGLDIAAMQRDRQGRPLDEVMAVADGRVGYVNRIGGNSNYGIYVVLLHDDPALGEVYTLYAHLARAETSLQPGRKVRAGDVLGTMGNTASSGIPMVRAHLHFEIGLVNNMRFAAWYKANKLKPYHANFHGRNFLGVNPLDVFAHQQRNPDFDFLSHLETIPPAFELIARTARTPDFFTRYPGLWEGPPVDRGVMVLKVSEGGLPLRGREATDEELAALGRGSSLVLNVNEAVLGRNGCHLISRLSGSWKLASNGQKWLEILAY